MIKGYFGVPGCGKSTVLAKIGHKEITRLKKHYRNVFTVNIDIVGCTKITKSDVQKFKFNNDLILWDEITLDYDNRNFKEFTQEDKEFWLLHRHMGVDVIYATQNYENVDKKIRDLTMELWYMSKSVVPLLGQFTTSKRIYRNITINEMNSDLTMGYRFCNFIEGLFVKNFEIVFRRLYYKYFDSFDLLELQKREQIPYNNVPKKRKVLKIWKKLKKKKSPDGLEYY